MSVDIITMTWGPGTPPYVYWGTVYTGTPRSFGDLARTKNIIPDNWGVPQMYGTESGVFGSISGDWDWASGEYGTHTFDVFTDTAWKVSLTMTVGSYGDFELWYADAETVLWHYTGGGGIYGGNGRFQIARSTSATGTIQAKIDFTYSTEGGETTLVNYVYGNPS